MKLSWRNNTRLDREGNEKEGISIETVVLVVTWELQEQGLRLVTTELDTIILKILTSRSPPSITVFWTCLTTTVFLDIRWEEFQLDGEVLEVLVS